MYIFASCIISLINELQDQKVIPESKVILAGFSQGATISNLVTLQNPAIVRSLLIMSGRLTEQIDELLDVSADLKKLPVFAGHGARTKAGSA